MPSKTYSKNKEYFENNKEAIRTTARLRRAKNPEKFRAKERDYYTRKRAQILERKREYYNKNKEKIQEYRDKNKARIAETRTRYRERNKWKCKVYELARVGCVVSEQEIEALYLKFNNACAICERSEPEVQLHTDHDHELNKLRGVLCSLHNKALGLFKDKIEHLLDAAEYLRSFYASHNGGL